MSDAGGSMDTVMWVSFTATAIFGLAVLAFFLTADLIWNYWRNK